MEGEPDASFTVAVEPVVDYLIEERKVGKVRFTLARSTLDGEVVAKFLGYRTEIVVELYTLKGRSCLVPNDEEMLILAIRYSSGEASEISSCQHRSVFRRLYQSSKKLDPKLHRESSKLSRTTRLSTPNSRPKNN
jgi:hypothetical protein